MAHIKGGAPVPAAYSYHPGDAAKTSSALRSTFQPSISDRLTNQFARQGHPTLAKFVNSFRQADLSIRQALNQQRLSSERARADAFMGCAPAVRAPLAGGPIGRHEHQARRLDTKRMLGEVAQAGVLHEGLELANEGLQEHLAQAGYVPLSGLSATPHDHLPSRYLVAPGDGHRIKIHSEAAPKLARMISSSVSAGYERTAGGAGRSMRSAAQQMLVGAYSAQQSAKGQLAGSMANSSLLDPGARARMEVRTARAGQNRTMMQAALGGNEQLNSAYRGVLDQQIEQAWDRVNQRAGTDYAVRSAPGGIKPPQTRFWERRVNAFYEQGGAQAGAASAAQATSLKQAPSALAGSIARFALGVANVRNKAAQQLHLPPQSSTRASSERSPDASARVPPGVGNARDRAAAAKLKYGAAVRHSAMKGNLIATLANDRTRQVMEQSFPRTQDHSLHHPKPWIDDDDLYN